MKRMAWLAGLPALSLSVASAAELPISGVYGSEVACAHYVRGGVEAVQAADSQGLSLADPGLLILPDRAIFVGSSPCNYDVIRRRTGEYYMVYTWCYGDKKPRWLLDIEIHGDIATVVNGFDSHEFPVRRCVGPLSMLPGEGPAT